MLHESIYTALLSPPIHPPPLPPPSTLYFLTSPSSLSVKTVLLHRSQTSNDVCMEQVVSATWPYQSSDAVALLSLHSSPPSTQTVMQSNVALLHLHSSLPTPHTVMQCNVALLPLHSSLPTPHTVMQCNVALLHLHSSLPTPHTVMQCNVALLPLHSSLPTPHTVMQCNVALLPLHSSPPSTQTVMQSNGLTNSGGQATAPPTGRMKRVNTSRWPSVNSTVAWRTLGHFNTLPAHRQATGWDEHRCCFFLTA